MPLQHGSTRDIISHNISEMVASGHPQAQAVAAALHTAHPNAKPHSDPPAHTNPHTAACCGSDKMAAKMNNLKRPSLHPKHPFNSKHAPDNRKKAMPAPQTMSTRDVVKGAIVPGGSRVPVVSGGEFSK